MEEPIIIQISPDMAGTRLDKLLDQCVKSLSRSRIKSLIQDGCVQIATGEGLLVGGHTVTTPSRSVKSGEWVSLTLPALKPAEPQAESIPLDIIFEDDHLVVVNKAPGMVVHPAPGAESGTLVNALLHHAGGSLSGIGGVIRPGIVHRIDKDTSGLLVVAKDDKTHRGLAEQFAAHTIKRLYTALCRGVPAPPDGRIEGNIARHPVNRKKMAVTDKGGKHAVTHYRSVKFYASGGSPIATELECQLETGRTHQVRVHMAHRNCPLIGDPVYGNPGRLPNGVSTRARALLAAFPRQALHARTLGFHHPVIGKDLLFHAQLPHDMEQFFTQLSEFEVKQSFESFDFK